MHLINHRTPSHLADTVRMYLSTTLRPAGAQGKAQDQSTTSLGDGVGGRERDGARLYVAMCKSPHRMTENGLGRTQQSQGFAQSAAVGARQVSNLKSPSSDQGFDYLVDCLLGILPMGKSLSQPHVQRMWFGVIVKRAIALALDDVVPSDASNVTDKFRDVETSACSSMRQLDKLVH
jgi:hypothetical protein